jgi:hypothetical protein
MCGHLNTICSSYFCFICSLNSGGSKSILCQVGLCKRLKLKSCELKNKDPLTRATKGYESALDWIFRRDKQNHLGLFFSNTRLYDKVRKEKFLEVFPEWTQLFDKYEKK